MDMILKIKEKLNEIEEKENVKILLAIESRSRAWGFASPDSDYDAHFIYVRPLKDYLRLDEIKDVIEWQLDEVLDINGWDLKKLSFNSVREMPHYLNGVTHLLYIRSFLNGTIFMRQQNPIFPPKLPFIIITAPLKILLQDISRATR